MSDALTYENEIRATAQQLYDSYSTVLSENALSSLLDKTKDLSFSDLEDNTSARGFINNFILQHYPNEMTIKANFVNNVLLKQGSTNVSIFELPIGGSRIDICKVNGHSSAYEIKTDLDTFSRLEGQLQDYFDVFEHVYVITSEKRMSELPDYVPAECGIFSYRQKKDGRYAFTLRRAAVTNRHLDARKQLDIISKKDLCAEYGLDAKQPRTALTSACLEARSADEINRFFKRHLKQRYGNQWRRFKQLRESIFEIDYEWFFRNELDPDIVY